MAYVGGKSKGAEHILKVLNRPEYDNMPYLEPFVGMAHILRRVNNKKKYIASDKNRLVIKLLQSIKKNENYPKISKKRYYELKLMKITTFERALAAFCYSYNGKEWGGYVKTSKPTLKRPKKENYPAERKRYYEKLKSNKTFKKTKIIYKDYKKWNPKGYLIYCDPPYASTQGYTTGDFDNEEFWNIMREWSKNNHVFISEYKAPKDFKCVAKATKKMSLSGKGSSSSRIEKLFTYKNPTGGPPKRK